MACGEMKFRFLHRLFLYDALVSERVYKKAISHEKAIEMILNGECGVFNPILMECLVDIKDKIHKESQLEVLR